MSHPRPLHLHNTQTRQKELFTPLEPGHVRLYVCGPTVYNAPHIGNARPAVVFDVLYRVLRALYARVTYVRNITDVDDKIMEAARTRQLSCADLTAEMTHLFHQDMAALGVCPPTHEPYATHHIPQMLDLIAQLLAQGLAYEALGHVLFSVRNFPSYGELSGRSLETMHAGARVEVAAYKKDPMDFVLWKPSTPEQMGWDSPWGRGRPGWHIECSAMSRTYLGDHFDIHGGGQDLMFPHHENERAQSLGALGCTSGFARYWMHNGYVNMAGEKMSKSLGNVLTVRELRSHIPGEVLRYVLLSHHYRQPLAWHADLVASAHRAVERCYRALYRHPGGFHWTPPEHAHAKEHTETIDKTVVPFVETPISVAEDLLEALCDDLNTPLALSHLHQRIHATNTATSEEAFRLAADDLYTQGRFLGLLTSTPTMWFQGGEDFTSPGTGLQSGPDTGTTDPTPQSLSVEAIETLLAARSTARSAKDFKTADALRRQLAEAGITLEDRAHETLWHRTPSALD